MFDYTLVRDLHNNFANGATPFLYRMFGRNEDVDATEYATASGTPTWTTDLAGVVLELDSTSASDTAAGSGCQQVEILGIAGSGESHALKRLQVETSGTTSVFTSGELFYRVLELRGIRGAVNIGEVFVRRPPSGSGDIQAQMVAGRGVSHNAIFCVPGGCKAQLLGFGADCLRRAAQSFDINLWCQPQGKPKFLKHTFSSIVNSNGHNAGPANPIPMYQFNALDDIWAEFTLASANGDFTCWLDFLVMPASG